VELYYEGGMLRQRHTPFPQWYPLVQDQPMVRILDTWFIAAIVRDGNVWEMVSDMVYEFDGVKFRHVFFRPTFQKWAGITCGGVQVHVTDREAFTPVAVGIAMVKTAYDLYTDKFQWKQGDYEYEFGKNPFDVVCGTDKIRKAIEAAETLDSIQNGWQEGLSVFKDQREQFLLY